MNVPPDALALRVADLCRLHLRAPTDVLNDGVTGEPFLAFSPVLTVAEQTTYARILRIARSTLPSITPAEWLALEPDLVGLRTYQGLASPTLAQTVSAVKAQSRILRALLRD